MSKGDRYEKDALREVRVEEAAEDKKGRSFAATLFAWVEADGLWEGGSTDTVIRRPVYAVFGCSTGALAPFKANLRLGRKAEVPDGYAGDDWRKEKAERWEFLRSAGYDFRDQVHADVNSVALQVLMPSLVRIDPGMVDPKGASFVMLPTRAWAARQKTLDDAAALRHVQALGLAGKATAAAMKRSLPGAAAAVGALFTTYVDRRTRCPLPADARLYLQVLVAAIDAGYASVDVQMDRQDAERKTPWGWNKAIRYEEHGLDRVGILPGVAFNVTHEKLEPFLATQVDTFMRVCKVKG